ncbi:unnamed protein product [Diamesa tonsa]
MTVSKVIQLTTANWGTPGSSQYHIQTDEGPERYFRYQTDNGQFRKEKRLKDGTVVGTNAWIDGFGYLRQNDYIADHEGYRILKSKTVFVGKDRPIEEALKVAKKEPATGGTLVKNHQTTIQKLYVPPVQTPIAVVTTPAPPISSTVSYPSYTTPGYYYSKAPSVYIQPKSQPDHRYLSPSNDLDKTGFSLPSNDIQQPSVYYLPPHEDTPRNDHPNSPPIALFPSSTPSPNRDESHLPPIALYPSSTPSPYESNSVVPLANKVSINQISTDLLPPLDYNVIPLVSSTPLSTFVSSYSPSYESPSYESSTVRSVVDYNRNSIEQNYGQSYYPQKSSSPSPIDQNVPLFDRSKIQLQQQQQFAHYDGVSATNNGFRYFLPRQYQEEVNNNDGSKDGSFGYIDPFGIRRVVYYNAGNNGFVHRKNNRYVGFNAQPYDPRPN